MKTLLITARIFSSVFRPSYFPTVGMLLLVLFFPYLNQFPLSFKLWLLSVTYIFTLCLPALGIFIYRRLHGWSRSELRKQHKRIVPYTISICCYICLMHILHASHMPHFITAIISISLLIQCSCIIINVWWKVSLHAAGSGGAIGAIVGYSDIYTPLFGFNPLRWLSLAILVSGCVMTSRMILRQHTLAQVLGGTLIGIACGIVGTLLM